MRRRCSIAVAPNTLLKKAPKCCADSARPTTVVDPDSTIEIGRNESRRVDEAKARHRQHAVRKLADVVSRQIGGHFLLELGFGTGVCVHERAVIRLTSSQSGHGMTRALYWGLTYQSRPLDVQCVDAQAPCALNHFKQRAQPSFAAASL